MIRILSVTLASASLFLASCATKKDCSSCDAAQKPAAACCSKGASSCCASGHKK